MMLGQLSPLSWIQLIIGLVVFLGPGYLFLSLSPLRKELDRTFTLVASFGLSISLWALLLSITNLFRLSIPAWLGIVLFAFCGLVGLFINKPWQSGWISLDCRRGSLYRTFLWLILGGTLFIELWNVRSEVAGLGSDSYHHTLFTQLIMEEGRLPESFGPFTPVVTFTYHFGFHAMAAFLGWTSDLPTRLLLLAVGKILIILCALSVALAAEKSTGSRIAGTCAAILTATVCVFPSYMLEWGRYTQLTGLTLMSLFAGLFWIWMQRNFDLRMIPVLSILAVGIALSHYRVIAMTVEAAVIFTLSFGLGRFRVNEWKKAFIGGTILVSATFLAFTPWLFHLWTSNHVGYKIISSFPLNSYFTIQRLGQPALDYPTNIVILTIGGISLIAGFIFKERLIVGLTLWTLLMLVPSRYVLLIDTVSVIISLFIPLAIIIGWGLFQLEQATLIKNSILHLNGLTPAVIFALSLSGMVTKLTYPINHDSYVRLSDMTAMEFIKKKIPENAYFMINIYRFPFSDTLMVGSDAGYWIPLLANRRTVIPPMGFASERVKDPHYIDKLRKIEQLSDQLTSAEGMEMLREVGVTHIYIGERGGAIDPEELLSSNHFTPIYQNGPVYIFRVNTK